jgi:hypothetical protein
LVLAGRFPTFSKRWGGDLVHLRSVGLFFVVDDVVHQAENFFSAVRCRFLVLILV